MPRSTVTIKVPGKLMIAGEYAVLDQYQRTVVMAADRYMHAVIQDSEENRLTLTTFGLKNLPWRYDAFAVQIDSADERIRFVHEAMTVALSYLSEQEIELTPFSLELSSELDDEASGIKYGLGSSAASVTAAVSAILHRFLPEAPAEELVFKLAAIAHVKVQGSGSGADVAASSFGGWLAYSSFQAEWLLEELEKKQTLSRLVKKNWQYLKVEKLEFPDDLHLCVGWTGTAASTRELVAKVREMKYADHAAYAGFMVQSGTAVQGLIHGMKESDAFLILEGIQMNREALKKLGQDAGVEIETPKLSVLCDLAEELGGAGKPSGAGGGDCGIAFVQSLEAKAQLEIAWKKAGIVPLNIQPQQTGVSQNS